MAKTVKDAAQDWGLAGNNTAAVLAAGEVIGAQIGRVLDLGPRTQKAVLLLDANGSWRPSEDYFGRYVEAPNRIVRRIKIAEPGSLVAYLQRWAHTGILYADLRAETVLAVLDDHGTTSPSWATHRATLACRLSEEAEAWYALNEQKMSQVELAEFIEAHLDDFETPSHAELMERVLAMQASMGAKFQSKVNLVNGERQFLWMEDIKDGEGGAVKLPQEFRIAIPIFEGDDPRRLDVLLRYRIQAGACTLWYSIRQPQTTRRSAFRALVANVAQASGCTAIYANIEQDGD